MSDTKSGYYVEFCRGSWQKHGDAKAEHEKGPAVYYGSITEGQAIELDGIVRRFLDALTTETVVSDTTNTPSEIAARLKELRDALPNKEWSLMRIPGQALYDIVQMMPAIIAALESAAAPAVGQGSPFGRDADWVLAMADALGHDSGYNVPIVPEAEPFRKLFAEIRAAPERGKE